MILASGPSAAELDIYRWEQLPIITLNGAVSKLIEASIRPMYYVCSDRSFHEQQPTLYEAAVEHSQRLALWPEDIQRLSRRCAGKAYALRKAHRASFRDYFGRDHGLAVRLVSPFSKRARDIGFSKDMDYGIFDVRTVAYICLQLAYHLGFDEIYLAGVDLNVQAPRFYESAAGQSAPCGLDQHLQTRILLAMRLAAGVLAAEGRGVINLSQQSLIPEDVFPRACPHQVQLELDSPQRALAS
ncbi:6-hydroxymethylpterin diphosphokinase MptE-like protein [Pseudomonas oryzihabitans]|uniref:6-hydroxymethylpterin diphosphokinase MptE-like protein n=1 Tax=Pseudomonas oryzihabitans TaxID=47885 RepID=UPI00289404B5|nr:6-hydroxymethylpterin diphosphokinase MptE-like protein [Pseudomonas oryzihabitans]MDT3722475.1 6-hydroxymethylpterin diphosphokinase MptE-like protein [Pseudomonas oryzihabitans]